MTENEAMTKICPLLIAPLQIAPSIAINTRGTCKGSECMMWRSTGWMPMVQMEGDQKKSEYQIKTGYCGLAGKP